jgi:hypothetical protein
VVLDLIAEVAADHVKQRATVDIRGAVSWRTDQPPLLSSSVSCWVKM